MLKYSFPNINYCCILDKYAKTTESLFLNRFSFKTLFKVRFLMIPHINLTAVLSDLLRNFPEAGWVLHQFGFENTTWCVKCTCSLSLVFSCYLPTPYERRKRIFSYCMCIFVVLDNLLKFLILSKFQIICKKDNNECLS